VCSPCTLTLTIIAGLVSSSFYGLGAIYAEGLGFSKIEIALFVSVTLFAPVVSQLPIGTVADLYGRAPISAVISVLAAVGAALLASEVPGSFLAVTVMAGIVTSLSHPLYALGHSRLVDGGHELITATTAGLIGYNIGTFLGPFGAALAMDRAGPAGLYSWVSFCLVFGVCVAVLATLQPRTRCCPL
jgi:MFS family permease